jgi:endonuclease/exonuclease/phosphatase family metal-dependent hydrolase
MRILTWNILHGGGRERSPWILMEILALRPDVIVVTEARRRFAAQLAGAFADAGLVHTLGPDAPDGVNAIMLLSREPLEAQAPESCPDCMRPRWLEARLPGAGIRIAGVHLPEAERARAHAESWNFLLRSARARRSEPAVLAGDLNTWRNGPESRPRNGSTATNLGRLASLGFVDAWLVSGGAPAESTWKAWNGEAFRLDYVLVSEPLAGAVGGARVIPPRPGAKLSDHAALVVDISLPG